MIEEADVAKQQYAPKEDSLWDCIIDLFGGSEEKAHREGQSLFREIRMGWGIDEHYEETFRELSP